MDCLTLEGEQICCSETPTKDYPSTLRKIPEESRSYLHHAGIPKSRILHLGGGGDVNLDYPVFVEVVFKQCVNYAFGLISYGR
jgi:hypothetical protein